MPFSLHGRILLAVLGCCSYVAASGRSLRVARQSASQRALARQDQPSQLATCSCNMCLGKRVVTDRPPDGIKGYQCAPRGTSGSGNCVQQGNSSNWVIQTAAVIAHERFCLFTCKPLLTRRLTTNIKCTMLNIEEITLEAQNPSGNGRAFIFRMNPMTDSPTLASVQPLPTSAMEGSSIVQVYTEAFRGMQRGGQTVVAAAPGEVTTTVAPEEPCPSCCRKPMPPGQDLLLFPTPQPPPATLMDQLAPPLPMRMPPPPPGPPIPPPPPPSLLAAVNPAMQQPMGAEYVPEPLPGLPPAPVVRILPPINEAYPQPGPAGAALDYWFQAAQAPRQSPDELPQQADIPGISDTQNAASYSGFGQPVGAPTVFLQEAERSDGCKCKCQREAALWRAEENAMREVAAKQPAPDLSWEIPPG